VESKRPKTRRTQGVLGGRSKRVVRQVLEAAVTELSESGYRAFRMDEVSRQARVNKTTIYRRWPSKVDLVAAAVDWMRPLVHDVPLPDTGTLERDLVEAFRRRGGFKHSVEGRAFAQLLAEQHDPELRAIVGPAVDERSASWRELVTRAVTRGQLPKGTDPGLLLGMLKAIVDAWSPPPPGRLKRSLLETAVRTIVAGARSGALVAGNARPRR
jgi:AcrR family transcriptional regulator